MRKSALIMGLSLASTGCATLSSFQMPPFLAIKQSSRVMDYVSPEVSLDESRKITSDMALFLADQLPPARTTIDLVPATSQFHEMLASELAWRGFGVSYGSEEEDAVRLRYFVTLLDTGIVIRMKYRDRMAGRFYRRGNQLMGGVYAVREAGK